jgi:polysaccharide export outer membrane protein
MAMLKKLLILFLWAALVSCASQNTKTQSLLREFERKKAPSYVAVSKDHALRQSLSGVKRKSPDYIIGAEDLLQISVFKTDIDRKVRVSSQGYITLPLIGVIKARGLTARALEKEITQLFKQRYIRNPQVSVFIEEYRSQRVSVIGAVVQPKTYELSGYYRLLDVISLAGGLTDDAGKLVRVLRPSDLKGAQDKGRGTAETAPAKETLIVDLEQLLVKGNMELNVPVYHGDVIHVPPAGQVFVGGKVKKPGAYKIRDFSSTVTQMIAQAEGLAEDAKPSRAVLFRETPQGQREKILIDIAAIQKGNAEDIQLKPNDVIFVPKDQFKMFLYGIRDFFYGIFHIGYSVAL